MADPSVFRADPPRLNLYGAATLALADRAPAPLERKQAALLAFLALSGPSPRARLAGLLWPEASAAGARGNLRQCLARLRRLSPDVLVDDGEMLSLAPSLALAAPVPGGPALLAAHDYADCDELARWLQARVDDAHASRRKALLAGIRSATQRGDLDLAQDEADALLALDRESEDAYRALMEVAYLRGDFAAAVAIWDGCRTMLRELYGVVPSTATQSLGTTILQAARINAGPSAAPAPAIPLSVLRPPHLIGRDPQLQALRRAWLAGQTVCVSGEAGIGKSRILAELAATLGDSVAVAARPGDAVTPYASLTRLVAAAIDRFRPPLDSDDLRWSSRLLPGIGYLVPGAAPAPLQTERERHLAMRHLFALLASCRERGCAAFVLDDLQFADRASIEALQVLIGELAPGDAATAPRFALGSRVDDAEAASTALLDALGATRDFLRVELSPLAGADVSALLASLALPSEARLVDLDQRLFAQVGGNPAFLLESLKLLLSLDDGGGARAGGSGDADGSIPIPPGIEAIIQRRVALLGAPARHIAQLAAIAGASYSVEMAAAALACPVFALTEPLQELERRQVLVGRQFVHDLVAQAAKRSIPTSVAEFMQRFVADHLEARDGDPAVVAGHWHACGEWQRAGLGHVRAAARALAAMRPREQAENLDAAIDCFERAADDDALFDAIAERLKIMEVADRTVVRARLNERLGALARSEEQQVRVLLHRASFFSDHSRLDGLASLEQGFARAQAHGLQALAFEFVEPMTQVLAANGRAQDALRLIESFMPWVDARRDASQQGQLQRMLAATHVHGDRLLRSIEHGRRAVALFRSAGDDLRSLPTMSNIGLALHWRSELDAARAVLEDAVRLRDRLHGGLPRKVLDTNLAAVLRDLGEFALAEERLEDIAQGLRTTLAQSPDEPPTDLAITENHLAQLWLMLGQPDRALACLRVDDAAVDPRFRARRIALRLRAARARGDDTGALDAVAATLVAQIGSPFQRALFELEVLRSRPAVEALAGYARLHDETAVLERPGLRLHAALRAAESALAVGDREQAARWADVLRSALSAVTPYDLDADEAWRIARAVFVAIGDRASADEAARRAKDVVEALALRLPDGWRTGYLDSRRRRVKGLDSV